MQIIYTVTSLLTCASALAILAIVYNRYPGAPEAHNASTKTPPSWGPEMENEYPFDKYSRESKKNKNPALRMWGRIQ